MPIPRILMVLFVPIAVSEARDPVILSSGEFGTYLDTHDLGQTFTTTGPVVVSGVELYAKKRLGGRSFVAELCTYDPWNKIKGTPLATTTVNASSVSPDGGWFEVSFNPPAILSNPGVHGIFLSADTVGEPKGFSDFGLAWGDSISGGRFIGPGLSKTTELLFRLKGQASPGSLLPAGPAAPRISVSTERFYSSATRDWRIRFQMDWETVPGAAYLVYTSSDLVSWRYRSKLLGSEVSATYSTTNEFWSARYFKVEAILLGDLEF